MSVASQTYWTDWSATVVLDTSAAININATKAAATLLRALPFKFLVPDALVIELEEGRRRGRTDLDEIEPLIASGLIGIATLDDDAAELFMSLVVGASSDTLDDGEAATLAFAVTHRATPVIDERKAKRIAGLRFANLELRNTVDLFAHPHIERVLNREGLADAVFNALQYARMNVPLDREHWIVDLIGAERASRCPSLSRRARIGRAA